MSRRPVILAGILVLTGLVGGVSLTTVLKPKPFVVVQPEPRKAPLADHGPGRSLGPPANVAPESVVRTSLDPKKTNAATPGAGEGIVTTLTITTPVFEIDRRFRSMEGPHAEYDVRVDGQRALDGGLPSDARELLWWKGARIEVLDESGTPIGQEFMCHLNINVDPKGRSQGLGLRPGVARMLTLTQGELSFVLPKQRAVPVASDEIWGLMFQVLNRNRDGRVRVKQRLTLYFVRDKDLFGPIDAVNWTAGSIWVPLDNANTETRAFDDRTCHCCLPLTRGLEATNNVTTGRLIDETGRTLVGHWVVPPGPSTWSYPFSRSLPALAKDARLYATWTHVHPFAKEVRLIAHQPGCQPQTVMRSTIESETDDRVGLRTIRSLASADGEAIPDGASLELAVDYDNTSGRAQDSMTSLGVFVGVNDWKRPAWAARTRDQPDMESCGLKP